MSSTHQTRDRGQITTLLMQQGCDPGVTDLFAMLREEAARAAASQLSPACRRSSRPGDPAAVAGFVTRSRSGLEHVPALP